MCAAGERRAALLLASADEQRPPKETLNLPTVMIYQARRSVELKRRAAAAVTKSIAETYDLRPEQIHVYFH